MTTYDVLRVFVGPDGSGGNPLGVFLDGGTVPDDERQDVAADLGFSETVFVDDPVAGAVRIFTPAEELAFAGHPIVGTAWLLVERGWTGRSLNPPAGEIPVWRDGETTWMRARPEWSPQRDLRQMGSPDEVEALTGPDDGAFDLYAWAWIDEDAGIVRSRYFVPGLGVAEDEATGSAAVVLGSRLGRDLTIRQGVGSELLVRPRDDGSVDVGGRVEHLDRREY